jgi:hypothetical protein
VSHPIYRVVSYQIVGPYTVRVRFDDNSEQTIDFQPVLRGEIFGPLKDRSLFEQVRSDPEIQTLVWPNGADFDPATLHDWPEVGKALAARAQECWNSLPREGNAKIHRAGLKSQLQNSAGL